MGRATNYHLSMLKFFHGIRQKLLSENKFSKYLLYAIGEIVLVVIGILIALQINTWNEEQKSKALELNILKDLHNTLNADFELLNWGIAGNESAMESCKLVLAYLDQNKPYSDSLNFHFENSHLWWKTILTTSAYERAKEHGLDFINDSLRKNLNSLYNLHLSFSETLNEREELYYYHTASPILIQMFESTELALDNTAIEGNHIPLDFEKLKASERYKSILRTSIGNKKKLNTWLKFILNHMMDLDQGLKQAIEEY